MGKSTINIHFQWQTVSLPEGNQAIQRLMGLRPKARVTPHAGGVETRRELGVRCVLKMTRAF